MNLFPEERQKVLNIAVAKNNVAGQCVRKADGTPDWRANNVQCVIKAAKSSKVFANIGTDFIEKLSSVAVDRIFMPGDLILEEGAPGDSLFIMISGQAKVYIRQVQLTRQSLLREVTPGGKAEEEQKLLTTSIGMLHAGGISGEVAMLGISKTRGASV